MRILIGAGGLSRSIKSSLSKKSYYIDSFKEKNNIIIDNDINDNNFKAYKKSKFIVCIGDNKQRKKWFDKINNYGLSFFNVIDKTSNIDKTSKIGRGVFIGKNAIINANASIGDNCIINTGVIIEHSVKISNHCNISPGAVLNGDVKVGDMTWIGSNATIIGQVEIGKNCIIGANTIIRKNIPDNTVYIGNNEFLRINNE